MPIKGCNWLLGVYKLTAATYVYNFNILTPAIHKICA